jgi:Domain of unknown function (DUF4956)
MMDYLGFQEGFDSSDTAKLFFRLILEVLFAAIVIRGSYSRRHHNAEHVFTLWLFSIVTFCIAFLLRKVPMELGFALGLFAVFGVLRYRTESIAIKDLTYLFVVIGLALINALSNKKISFAELAVVNMAIVGAVVILERPWAVHEGTIRMLYDKVDLLGPQHRPRLLEELSVRMDVPVTRVVVHNVDLLRDTAELSIFFDVPPMKSPGPASRCSPGSSQSVSAPSASVDPLEVNS